MNLSIWSLITILQNIALNTLYHNAVKRRILWEPCHSIIFCTFLMFPTGWNCEWLLKIAAECWCLTLCVCVCAHSCLTVCDSVDCSPPGSSVHWISQASGLPFPTLGDLPNPGIKSASFESLNWQVYSLPLPHLGSKEGIYRVGFSTQELHRYRNQGVEAGVTLLTIIPPPHSCRNCSYPCNFREAGGWGCGWKERRAWRKAGPPARLVLLILNTGSPDMESSFFLPLSRLRNVFRTLNGP